MITKEKHKKVVVTVRKAGARKVAEKRAVPKLNTTKSALKAFLVENPRKQFQSSDAEHCPIAKFLNSQLPSNMRTTVDGEITIYSKLKKDLDANGGDGILKTMKLPTWMESFIDKFDHMESAVVTGREVLDAGII